MHSRSLAPFFILISSFVLTLSLPADDLNSDTLLFDTEPSPFLDSNELLTTDAALSNPCAPQDDLSLTEGTNLFSREEGAQCLPPVNIGADASQLFDNPLDLLEKNILPLNGDENSDDSSPFQYPGLLPGGDTGNYNAEDAEKQGWQPYTGPVHIQGSDDVNCRSLSAISGEYPYELCCDGLYLGYEAQSIWARTVLGQIDARTVANQDYAVIFRCIRQ